MSIKASETNLSILLGSGPRGKLDTVEQRLRQATQDDLNANKATLLFPFGAQ
jgi:hypothetical protein